VSLRAAWERNALDQFLALLPPPRRLALDLGCGEGRLSRE